MSEQSPSYFERFKLIKQGLLPKEAVAKPKKRINQISDKKAAAMKEEKAKRGDNDTELQKFFKRAIIRMTGWCEETNAETSLYPYNKAINCVAHILSQQQCPSVRTHPSNWIEFEEVFHKRFDRMNWKEREKLKCWPIIRDKLVMIYPDLAEKERRHFPQSVLDYMEKNKPF